MAKQSRNRRWNDVRLRVSSYPKNVLVVGAWWWGLLGGHGAQGVPQVTGPAPRIQEDCTGVYRQLWDSGGTGGKKSPS